MACQNSSRPAGSGAERERNGDFAARVARNFAESDCDARVVDFRFSRRVGRAGGISAPTSGVRARGEKVLSLQNSDPARDCGGPKQLFLSKMSAFAARFCCAAVAWKKRKKS